MGGGSGVKVWNDCYPAHQLACCWEGGGGGGPSLVGLSVCTCVYDPKSASYAFTYTNNM